MARRLSDGLSWMLLGALMVAITGWATPILLVLSVAVWVAVFFDYRETVRARKQLRRDAREWRESRG